MRQPGGTRDRPLFFLSLLEPGRAAQGYGGCLEGLAFSRMWAALPG
jgi:hypothetical protein